MPWTSAGILVAALFQPVTFSVFDSGSGSSVTPFWLQTIASKDGKEVVLQKIVVREPTQVVAIARTGKLLTLNAIGYATATLRVDQLQPDNPVPLLQMVEVHGIIRDALSHQPVSLARVQVLSGDGQLWLRGSKVDSVGSFSVKAEPGRIRVSAWAPGYSQALTTVDVKSGAKTTVTLELQPGVTLRGGFPALGPPLKQAYIEARPTAPPAMFVVRSKVQDNLFELRDLSVGGTYEVRYSSPRCPRVTVAKLERIAAANVVLNLPLPRCESR